MSKQASWHYLSVERVSDPEEPSRLDWGIRKTSQTGVSLVSGDDSVRQSLLLLLMTRPGERVMRPDYGCDIHRLLFAPNNDATANIALHYVRRAIIQWEPRVDIIQLQATRPNPHVLLISLDYRVRTTGSEDQLDLSIELMGDR